MARGRHLGSTGLPARASVRGLLGRGPSLPRWPTHLETLSCHKSARRAL